jgi:hypothetical protein
MLLMVIVSHATLNVLRVLGQLIASAYPVNKDYSW